jgi:hypothetical protein
MLTDSEGVPDKVKPFVIGCEKWEDTEMIKVPIERRGKKGRLGMSMPCSVCAESKTFKDGTTFDVSKGGMCVFSNNCFEIGHIIEIQCEAIWDRPKTGTVKWCQKVKHNLYRIGISFS